MLTQPHRIGSLASLSLLLISALALVACGNAENEQAVDEAEIRDEFTLQAWATAEYTVRGLVVALPTGDDDLQVQHEAIPEYRKPTGFGMPVMTMGFPLAENVSLAGIEPGDKVSITFLVDYEEGWSPLAYRAVAIEELPADTELDFTPLPEEAN